MMLDLPDTINYAVADFVRHDKSN